MNRKPQWFRIKQGFLRKRILLVKLDIGALYHITNGTQTPELTVTSADFVTVLMRAIKKTHQRFAYRQDQLLEKRSRKNLMNTMRQLGRR